ncbi:MAG: DUF418 domain-containing protein [Planctomycetes bacterium]|nr:DUF418 domain-containing protein [Planctomycetota bacterium]
MNDELDPDNQVGQTAGALTPPTEPPPPAVSPRPLGPVQEPERIVTLDVLRGFAIFGIFMVNIAFFAMPLAKIIDHGSIADVPPADQISHAIVRAIFEYKFVSLFSLLFGVGLVIQMGRAEQRGRPFVPVYLRRTVLLMLFGLAHGLLLWYGDILFIYSIVALLVLLLRKLAPTALMALAAGAIALSVLFAGGSAALGVIFQPPSQDAAEVEAVESAEPSDETELAVESPASDAAADDSLEDEADDRWDRFVAALEASTWQPGDPAWVEAGVIAYKEGPMSVTLLMRAITFGVMLVFVGILSGFGFRVAGMFLLGMALMKLNFFAAERRRWHWAFCILGLTIGVPGELWLVWSYYHSGYELGWTQAGAEVIHNISSLALCLGYVGALTLIVQAGLLRWLTYAFSCVGRTALSNYLLQTIIATYLMYWWGLGWFNEVSRPQQLALVVGIYAVQMVLSVLWLRVFTIGPFEWLWRSLTYLKPQPVLRRRETTSPMAA